MAQSGGELIIYVTYIGAVRKTSSDCSRLQMILDNHGIKYTKVDLGVEPEKREQMVKKSGKKTLPQVFIDDLYIGVSCFIPVVNLFCSVMNCNITPSFTYKGH